MRSDSACKHRRELATFLAQLGTRQPLASAVFAHPRQERRARSLGHQTIRLGQASSNLVHTAQHNGARGHAFLAKGTSRKLSAVLIEQRQRQRKLAVVQSPLGLRE
jgi:hypothetical protein